MLANPCFGTIVTANGGGYTWSNNSRENKITTWSNDPVGDKPSEKIFLISSDIGSSGTPTPTIDIGSSRTSNPTINNKKIYPIPNETLSGYEIHYGFGYAIFKTQADELEIETLIYVPINKNKKVVKIIIHNLSSEMRKYKVCYCADMVLGVDKEYTKKHLTFEKIQNGIRVKNYYRDFYKDEFVDVVSFSRRKECEIDSSVDENKNVLISNEIVIRENENVEVCFEIIAQKNYRGEMFCNNSNSLDSENIENSQDDFNIDTVNKDFEETKMFWKNMLGKIQISAPVESMNIIMNGWLGYQTIVSRLWGRTSFYQAGGAFGFRDQLQDSLIMLYIDPEFARRQILYHAAHEFKEGDVLHWWHPEKNNGIRTRYTDDLLWLPYLVCEYIEKTNNYNVLDEETAYVEMDALRDDEGERYSEVSVSDEKESLYMHAIRAIDKSLSFGENGLANMGTGDWNDGMNKINGQSVWLSFFMYDVIKKFIPICEYKKDFERIEKYEAIINKLKEDINNNAWDGNWYKRAFFKDGTPLGSNENDECKIDGISQSWAVISGAGEKEKCIQAMNSLENYLVDKENMIIKLLTPPFSKGEKDPGYIKSYIPGVRENGGQYTHGAIWSVIANAILKDGERAGEYFRILNPIEHARTKEASLKYKVEPYVIAADVYSNLRMLGRGGWTWYTGSSSWLYIAGFEYILGIKKSGNLLKINPCIPKEWERYMVDYEFENSHYIIEVFNPDSICSGIKIAYLDNNEIKLEALEKGIAIEEGEHKVDVIMG